MDKRKRAFSVALASMTWLLASCNRVADESPVLKGPFYALDFDLVFDDSTPDPLKTECAARDSENAYGNVCVERNSVANAVNLTSFDMHRDGACRDPVYDVQLHVAPKDQRRMAMGMIKAVQSRILLGVVSHGSVVAGVISLGGFGSVDAAKAAAARVEVPAQHP